MVSEHRCDYRSQSAAISSIAAKCCAGAQAVDSGGLAALTTDEREGLLRLVRENKELRGATGI
jgi:hypothetical protein